MDHVEPGSAPARMPLASLQENTERPRLVRWSMFDKRTFPVPDACYCWLDCETGRLVFSESRDRAGT